MPELPEVETVRRGLDIALAGKRIVEVGVLREISFERNSKKIVGGIVSSVERASKMLVVFFENKSVVLVVHLKMTGQLVWRACDWTSKKKNREVVGGHPTADWINELPSKHTRVIIRFGDNSKLFFNDLRVFGWMRVMNKLEWQEVIEKLPPDVIDSKFSVSYLTSVLKRSKRAVKLVLMDQQKMGGLGNIYANDALFEAGINPKKPSNTLNSLEIKKLYKAMRDVIGLGIKYGGATYSDFVAASGLGGRYQDHFLVYGREGEDCKECGKRIEKIMIGGRGSYFCPRCQK